MWSGPKATTVTMPPASGSKRAAGSDDLFSVLCRAETEAGERFSDEDVINHMIFTLMAAHDTSTITVAMMGYYLARHPGWQERLREESRSLSKTFIGYDDLADMFVPALTYSFAKKTGVCLFPDDNNCPFCALTRG